MLRKILQGVIGAGIFVYILYFLGKNQALFHRAYAGTAYHLAALFVCILATWVVASLQTLLPLRELGVRLGFAENLMVTLAAGFCNYLPLRAGTVLRLEYIKSMYGMGYLRYGSILGARALLLVWAAGAMGLAGAAGMMLTGRAVRWEVLALYTVILLAGVAPFCIPFDRLLPSEGRLSRLGRELTQSMILIRGNRRITVLYLGLVVLQFVLLGARLAVAFSALGQFPVFWAYFLLAPLTTLLSFVDLTPGNLGLREWAVGLITAALGADYSSGIFASCLDLAVMMPMTFAFGSLATSVAVLRMGRRAGAGRKKASEGMSPKSGSAARFLSAREIR